MKEGEERITQLPRSSSKSTIELKADVSEFRAIKNAILRDYRSGCIGRGTAKGRLLLLYRLTYPRHNSKARNISPRTRESLRREIREALRRI